MPVLATKLYIPQLRPKMVSRPRLIERLNEGLYRKLTLVSAPAGFGKSTVVSAWAKRSGCPVAWVSLDAGDHDPVRFLVYLISALQTISPQFGEEILRFLQAPQPPPAPIVLTNLLNEITAIPTKFMLVLDDYHMVDSQPVDEAITFLIEHLPPLMHMVIVTREDPQLPLPRLRARGQLTELRVADLRFTPPEAAEFFSQVMALNLSVENITALENRTEGWVAGLQLAALALQRTFSTQTQQEATPFIEAFSGSHHFVLDYLLEEVLHRQPENVQTFLLHTSILERMCRSLCDAVLGEDMSDLHNGTSFTLESLERDNLFLIPLDGERRWYRYHHLFSDLLKQRLQQRADIDPSVLHIRASQWYEDNGFYIEAFRHASAANDIERAERLITGDGIPRHFRGAVMMILDWFASLPKSVFDARPSLWWRYGALMLVNGQSSGVEEKLQAGEDAFKGNEADPEARHYLGRIASARATLALSRYQPDVMLAQSRRALEYLPSTNLSTRANAYWTQGIAYIYMGDRTSARVALTESITISQAAGDRFAIILATTGLGMVQEMENEFHQAAQTYRRVLEWAGDQPLQIINEAHIGLARILYEWNDLDAAEVHGLQSLQLARQYEKVIDRFIISEIFLARLKLARGDTAGAIKMLAETSKTVHQKNFVYRIPEVAATQVLALLQQGELTTAAQLAQTYSIPVSQARIQLAHGNPAEALVLLEPVRQLAVARGLKDEYLKVLAVMAMAYEANGEKDKAVQVLGETLTLAESGGFIRLFVDEGEPMKALLHRLTEPGDVETRFPRAKEYIHRLLVAFQAEEKVRSSFYSGIEITSQPLIEALSQREIEVLRLIAEGLSNQAISERLFLAVSSVKGHNQNIFRKLQVERRTEAVARARDLGLI